MIPNHQRELGTNKKIIEWLDLRKLTYLNRTTKAELLNIAFENAPEKSM